MLPYLHTIAATRAGSSVFTGAADVQDYTGGRSNYPEMLCFLETTVGASGVQAGDAVTVTYEDDTTQAATVDAVDRLDDALALAALDTTVYVQEDTVAKDSLGQETRTWADLSADAEASAAVLPLAGSKAIEADTEEALQRVRVRLAYRSDLAARGAALAYRLRTGGTSESPTGLLDIISVSTVGGPTGALDVIARRVE